MTTDPERDEPDPTAPPDGPGRTDEPETKPAEEWGERIDTGKRIARGGKEHGPVPGAEGGGA